jgi:putative oxygen-independent coproporphyrinogen III oxidase
VTPPITVSDASQPDQPESLTVSAGSQQHQPAGKLCLPPLSLYIHIPWCLKKCPYCDFNSHQARGELPEHAYVEQLLADLRHDLSLVQGRTLASIFIGGGTPSLFSAQALHHLLVEIEQLVTFSPDIEITLEANPGTFEQQKFKAFREAGINRLSIGIQSFDALMLQRLGRVHDGEEALRATDIARQAGFDNINLDLMFGLPGQSIRAALADLALAIQCQPKHLSWYQLTLEPNTEFYRFPPALPADDNIHIMHEKGRDLLAKHGFKQYEVSAYARDSAHSRHNLNYWEFGDYLGIGAGAHGKLTDIQHNHIIRLRKTRQPAHYLQREAHFTAECRVVPAQELPLEFMMNALRLQEGVPAAWFEQRTGLPLAHLKPQLTELRQRGWLQPSEISLAPSREGFQFLNDVLLTFA